ncbi:hypothetical protein L3Q82_020938 [Scortum barcoo]|uniref:Uncharacterized protein n=1 Tax=Scortum barcoo TaxID=214431 RepID=A0ACB8V925_9TELE|nr:hypothetical protein L3Q82_020938 [Scortum barcoo]
MNWQIDFHTDKALEKMYQRHSQGCRLVAAQAGLINRNRDRQRERKRRTESDQALFDPLEERVRGVVVWGLRSNGDSRTMSATKRDRNRLQRAVRTAERITWCDLPSIQDLDIFRVRKRTGNISEDPSHPGHNLFHLLPSGRRYRALYSFFPQAVTAVNHLPLVHKAICVSV